MFVDCDADSGVDESTQQETGDHQAADQKMDPVLAARRVSSSRIPRKTPPDSPLKKAPRARSTAPSEKKRMPRSKSVPKSNFAFSVAPPMDNIKKGENSYLVLCSHPPTGQL